MAEMEWSTATGGGEEKVSLKRKGERGKERRTVVDDRRNLLACERRLRVRERRKQNILDMDPDMMSEGVVVGVCSNPRTSISRRLRGEEGRRMERDGETHESAYSET